MKPEILVGHVRRTTSTSNSYEENILSLSHVAVKIVRIIHELRKTEDEFNCVPK